MFYDVCCSFLSIGTKDKTLNWWLLLQLLSYALKMAITVSTSRGSCSFTYNFSEVRSFIHLSWRYNTDMFSLILVPLLSFHENNGCTHLTYFSTKFKNKLADYWSKRVNYLQRIYLIIVLPWIKNLERLNTRN